MKKIIKVKNLDCENCSAKIQEKLSKINGVIAVSVSSITQKIILEVQDNLLDIILNKVKKIISQIAPEVSLQTSNDEISSNFKISLLKILFSVTIFIILLSFDFNNIFKISLSILAYLIVGYDIVLTAFKNIIHGKFFDENFLMTIATFGAFILGDYLEAIAVMLFFQIGELFQNYAVNKSRKSIISLIDIRPDYANIIKNGEICKVDPENIKINDIIIVKPGEKIPLDGVVSEGFSNVDTSAISGESMPLEIGIGDNVVSGSINLTGLIYIKVSKLFSDSTVSKILDLVENAITKKANVEKFITKFARYYTPIVVIIAIFLAIFPPLLISNENFSTWIYRAIVFLVISCPCALVISVPLGFFGGLGASSKAGILIKGSNFLEALSHTAYVVFDKTGTITKGNFKVLNIVSNSISKEELLKFTAFAESFSHHPIAESIKSEYGKPIELDKIKNVEELRGFGVKAKIYNKEVYVGNLKMMEKIGINPVVDKKEIGTLIYIAIDGKYAGYIVIADEIKEDSYKAIKELNKLGINKTFILTGDREEIANNVANKLCIENVCSELLPENKVEKIEKLIKEKKANEKLIFVGDGINDAPVLARADIGIAMGGIGSDIAIEVADIIIMNDELSKIATAIRISRRTIKIVKENIIFAIGIKVVILILGIFGYASIWGAIFADVGVSVIAILNSIRTLKSI